MGMECMDVHVLERPALGDIYRISYSKVHPNYSVSYTGSTEVLECGSLIGKDPPLRKIGRVSIYNRKGAAAATAVCMRPSTEQQNAGTSS